MQIRHAGPWIASVVNIKGILCNERHNADQHLWRQGGFIDNYCNCDCSCRLKTRAMAEQDLLTCWNKPLMTMKQKCLLAGPRSQPKPLTSLHLRCRCNERPYISDCSLIRTECASLIESVRAPQKQQAKKHDGTRWSCGHGATVKLRGAWIHQLPGCKEGSCYRRAPIVRCGRRGPSLTGAKTKNVSSRRSGVVLLSARLVVFSVLSAHYPHE